MSSRLGLYYLEGHEPVPVENSFEWARLFDRQKRQVALTELPDDVRISTVFLGMDHGFGDGPPVLFETMVFGGSHDQDQRRYSTWDEAAAGHEVVVAHVQSGCPGRAGDVWYCGHEGV